MNKFIVKYVTFRIRFPLPGRRITRNPFADGEKKKEIEECVRSSFDCGSLSKVCLSDCLSDCASAFENPLFERPSKWLIGGELRNRLTKDWLPALRPFQHRVRCSSLLLLLLLLQVQRRERNLNPSINNAPHYKTSDFLLLLSNFESQSINRSIAQSLNRSFWLLHN